MEKVYVAIVRDWLPLQHNQEISGIIDLPLEPSKTERLKWQVAAEANTKAKPSQTKWRVLSAKHFLPGWCDSIYGSIDQNKIDPDEDNKPRAKLTGVVLELRPVTGRTHQLRIHCAHVGSGIVGDSLYGKDRISNTQVYDPNDAARNAVENGPHLMLHASELTFPRPPKEDETPNHDAKACTFSAWPSWYNPST